MQFFTAAPVRALVIGANGQIGQELTTALRTHLGRDQVLATDIRPLQNPGGPSMVLDVTDQASLQAVVEQHQIDHIYNLAAILSAKGEQDPQMAWDLNMKGLLNSLEVMRNTSASRLFWPSSIAVFGPTTPREQTPQDCIMDPTTVYGISKLAGERWCAYYRERYGVDVRSLRYPGLISYKAHPGGGTTDYAVEIFHEAVKHGQYTAFLGPDSTLPMMYMPDAIQATLSLMDASIDNLKASGAYNVAGLSFSPAALTAAIQRQMPDFGCTYAPDFRQAIADSWPQSIDDSIARQEWNWAPQYKLDMMVQEMLEQIALQYQRQALGTES